ncbi:HEAT repeat domain-containing protein [Gottfriedia sp. NPDC057991]|uniref:HEAT repeat domain-containing protein n=1 Tax=Gottfriedia sp. NPDC057991 TaxID=3346298 RepID=UPI0036D7ED36
MTVIEKLASSLNRRDEEPNIELAIQVADQNDESAVKELIENLTNKNKNIQNDCIKVLYEIGERRPSLISDYTKEFFSLLESKNNRLQWGAMTALNSITSDFPEIIFSNIKKIIVAGDNGSVITKDQVVNILIKLCSVKTYAEESFNLLINQLVKSPTNQLPMYAERSMSIINEENKNLFIETLTSRLDEIEKETKRKRVEKVIKKIR